MARDHDQRHGTSTDRYDGDLYGDSLPVGDSPEQSGADMHHRADDADNEQVGHKSLYITPEQSDLDEVDHS